MVEKGIDYAINKIGPVVATSFPPLKPFVALMRYMQPWITEKAKPLVKEGILLLNKAAKASVRIALEDKKITKTNKIHRLLFS